MADADHDAPDNTDETYGWIPAGDDDLCAVCSEPARWVDATGVAYCQGHA